ncbi:glycoside hydrolase family 43 protein [Parvularcula sp. LCG005]|uniref:glycoside hydrolase family 43 protein n=1 Tax=Parvularcula sp. LCG005 TaxID=3078805 RepID=UPI00397D293A
MAEASAPAVPTARFSNFIYEGRDPVFAANKPEADEYQNPILAGFYPDPSLTRAGSDYYLVNSTFAYYPGIPVLHSTDLINWTQIGNVIDRPDMLDFDGLGLSRGVFAPTIEYHEGTFYVANTCVDCGGNFIVTATDPAGPWSDPIWLPEVGGIDPSVFFDEDGKVYVMNNDAPPGEPLYEGHRAIWLREVDPKTFQSIAEPTLLINGGVRIEEKPVWIEGPHIYKIGDWYYLSAAEGGTAVNHSQVVLRADNVLGPYEAYEGNPIMTQRHLPADRENPITSVGHADIAQDDAGNWWATFLGVRPYEGDYYNTGRETFLMPVRWEDGWPLIVTGDEEVKYKAQRPELPLSSRSNVPLNGNFTLTEDFSSGELPPHWMTLRVPKEQWYDFADGDVIITARADRLGEGGQPSLIARRQQHIYATATTTVTFNPVQSGDEAGLAVLQSDDYFYALGLNSMGDGTFAVTVRQKAGAEENPYGEVVAEQSVDMSSGEPLDLRITADGDAYDFFYRLPDGEWQMLLDDADGKILSTRTAGGFVGATFGLYAETSE